MQRKDYESLFILKPDFTEEEVDREVQAVKDIITEGDGSIDGEDRWGKKRLAYLVKKHRYGYYVLLRYSLEPGLIGKIDRHFRLSENVLKSMTVLRSSAGEKKEEVAASAAGEGETGAAAEKPAKETGAESEGSTDG